MAFVYGKEVRGLWMGLLLGLVIQVCSASSPRPLLTMTDLYLVCLDLQDGLGEAVARGPRAHLCPR